jgi:hypothetical protein
MKMARFVIVTFSENIRQLIISQIFDVIAEKGELWLAKNQDDPTETIGWIWNQHFARMVEF